MIDQLNHAGRPYTARLLYVAMEIIVLYYCIILRPLVVATHDNTGTCGRMYSVRHNDTCESILVTATNLTMDKFLSINPAINCSAPLKPNDQICISPCLKFTDDKHRTHVVSDSCHANIILGDYIGAEDESIRLEYVPVRDNVQHFFIFAFAIDANASGIVQNGIFSPYWAPTLRPASVTRIKLEHHHTKFFVSLAGYSQHINSADEDRVIEWYDPKNRTSWLQNAIHSVTSLVQTYHLDGIDIDYETFPTSRGFVSSIGQLIRSLKKKGVIKLASIAPYKDVLQLYKILYHKHGKYIDYVNYQFYANNYTSVADFVSGYKQIANIFPREKLLVGMEIRDRGLQGDDFFRGVEQVVRGEGPIPGMFLWEADNSKRNGFLIEKVAQCIF